MLSAFGVDHGVISKAGAHRFAGRAVKGNPFGRSFSNPARSGGPNAGDRRQGSHPFGSVGRAGARVNEQVSHQARKVTESVKNNRGTLKRAAAGAGVGGGIYGTGYVAGKRRRS